MSYLAKRVIVTVAESLPVVPEERRSYGRSAEFRAVDIERSSVVNVSLAYQEAIVKTISRDFRIG